MSFLSRDNSMLQIMNWVPRLMEEGFPFLLSLLKTKGRVFSTHLVCTLRFFCLVGWLVFDILPLTVRIKLSIHENSSS